MIVTMFTWIIMFVVFFGIGFFIQQILNRMTENTTTKFSNIIWLGVAGTTVYAQVWSIFGCVSRNAFLCILIMAISALLILRKQCIEYVRNVVEDVDYKRMQMILFVSVLLVALLFTIQEPRHYDTYLYHAQNIRWIEEYGIVKGLGNFHNRFAYNSSFMCLQALFSFKWCLGQSLHTLNGFFWIFMVVYIIGSLKIFRNKEVKIFHSDFLKGLMLYYLCNESILSNISSPHTDMLTLLLVAYIISSWAELLEKGVREYFPYSVLCLIGVFAVSVKLSAMLVLLLVIKPAVLLVIEKKWKVIGLFIACGIVIILPFLVRNVMISGYLVYPYARIDLFDVDWKMPASIVETDNHEIIAWGRLLNDVNRYEEPISSWLPIWLQKVEIADRIFMILNIVLVPISLVTVIYDFIKRRYDCCLMLFCCSSLFASWFFTAPLPRYGLIYLYLVPIYLLFRLVPNFFFMKWKNFYKVVFSLFLFGVSAMLIKEMRKVDFVEYLFVQADYRTNYHMDVIKWEENVIYVPAKGDQGNYYQFPSTPYRSRLERTELRGEDFNDGFRVKEDI